MTGAGAAGAPAVVLAGGDDASGLAAMLAGLLEDNLRDFPVRAKVARRARGDVVLKTSDRDHAVTLSFRPGTVVVADGPTPGAPVLSGPWLEMTKLCSGQSSAVVALARRRVTLGRGQSLRIVPAASFVLTVPSSFYGDRSRQVRRLAVGGGALLVAGMLLARRRNRPG